MSEDLYQLALEAAQGSAPAAEPAATPETPPEAEATSPADPAAGADDGPPPEEPTTEAAPDEKKATRKSLDHQAAELRKRQQKFKAQLDRYLADKTRSDAERQAFSAQIDLLRKGDARQILATLGQLTGRDPIETLRELNLQIATDGKAPPTSRESSEVAALRTELTELRDGLRKREAEQGAMAIEGRVRAELAQHVVSATFPELAAYAQAVGAEKAAAEMRSAMAELAKRGERVTTATICRLADAGLRTTDWRKGAGVAPQTPPGADTRAAPAAAKPVAEQSTPRGQSLAPSAAATAARTRALTPEERHAEQLRLVEGMLGELGA